MRKMRGKSTTPAKSSSRTRAVRTGITLTSQQTRTEGSRWRIPGISSGKNINNPAPVRMGHGCALDDYSGNGSYRGREDDDQQPTCAATWLGIRGCRQFSFAGELEKIRQGIALSDADRVPWLRAIRAAILKWIAA